jgi:hypothetical protein
VFPQVRKHERPQSLVVTSSHQTDGIFEGAEQVQQLVSSRAVSGLRIE